GISDDFDEIMAFAEAYHEHKLKLLGIADVIAMLPTDEKLKDILMDGYQMNDKNKERMRIGKYVRDKCAEALVGN
ncbi:hypothetical protein ACXWOQ_10365, partial [Streptococcus pyogenes]